MGKHKSIKILVTGGGGFVGLALIKRLIQLGYTVTNFSRQKYQILTDLGIVQIQGDLANSQVVNEAVKDQEVIFHVGAKAGFWGSYKNYYDSNVLGTLNLIEASQKQHVKKLIYTSSASVIFGGNSIENGSQNLPYPTHPLCHYTATKAIAEKAVLQANSEGFKTISLRPHIIWGPGDRHIVPRLIERAKAGKLRRIGDGKNRIDTVFIDNLIDAHLLALDALDINPNCRGKAYFVSNDEPVLLWAFINQILTQANIKHPQKSISQGSALFLSKILSGFHKIFRPSLEPTLTSFLVKELSQSHWFDISATKSDLKYSPGVSLAEGLTKLFKE